MVALERLLMWWFGRRMPRQSFSLGTSIIAAAGCRCSTTEEWRTRNPEEVLYEIIRQLNGNKYPSSENLCYKTYHFAFITLLTIPYICTRRKGERRKRKQRFSVPFSTSFVTDGWISGRMEHFDWMEVFHASRVRVLLSSSWKLGILVVRYIEECLFYSLQKDKGSRLHHTKPSLSPTSDLTLSNVLWSRRWQERPVVDSCVKVFESPRTEKLLVAPRRCTGLVVGSPK